MYLNIPNISYHILYFIGSSVKLLSESWGKGVGGGGGGSANGNSDCSFKNVPTIPCFEGYKNSSLGKTALLPTYGSPAFYKWNSSQIVTFIVKIK